jgi:hypothetical protein
MYVYNRAQLSYRCFKMSQRLITIFVDNLNFILTCPIILLITFPSLTPKNLFNFRSRDPFGLRFIVRIFTYYLWKPTN